MHVSKRVHKSTYYESDEFQRESLCEQCRPDDEFEDSVTTLAFGSCHNRLLAEKLTREDQSFDIWQSVASIKPQVWLWLGDSIYLPKKKGDGSVQSLENEYESMTSTVSSYKMFVDKLPMGAFGTWDDHDYGGNDRGREMLEREKRRDAFLDFLGNVPEESPRRHRHGAYSSVSYGTGEKKVKVIFLDTRWHRDRHIIPSLAASHFPLGSVLACMSRFLTSFYFPSLIRQNDSQMLGDEQWRWLESQVKNSDAKMHVIVSSIQVFTTNPFVESWGHFNQERLRLLRTIQNLPGLVILSGDVHHAEFIAVGSRQQMLEVTSSGMTHSCEGPFYGPLCKPILSSFPAHRLDTSVSGDIEEGAGHFTGKNFGSIDIDWVSGSFGVNIYDQDGNVCLKTTRLLNATSVLTESEEVFALGEGHKLPIYQLGFVISVILLVLLKWLPRKMIGTRGSSITDKKSI